MSAHEGPVRPFVVISFAGIVQLVVVCGPQVLVTGTGNFVSWPVIVFVVVVTGWMAAEGLMTLGHERITLTPHSRPVFAGA